MPAKKERPLEEIVADVKEYEDSQSAGAWRIVQPSGSHPVPHFVRFSEESQYNLMTPDEYKTEQRAALALALVTRPTQLTYQERAALLEILVGKE